MILHHSSRVVDKIMNVFAPFCVFSFSFSFLFVSLHFRTGTYQSNGSTMHETNTSYSTKTSSSKLKPEERAATTATNRVRLNLPRGLCEAGSVGSVCCCCWYCYCTIYDLKRAFQVKQSNAKQTKRQRNRTQT